ncbi:MAG: alkaline phosphatase family protein [Gemmatimonadales bacterium]|nr:alkaline phosphatase family protein [Gemmatimonadales bacterium]
MPIAAHVVLLIIDGLRPDAIVPDVMPALFALGERGYRATGLTVRPSVTVAALTSVASGVCPSVHGLTAPGLPSLTRLGGLRPLPAELRRHYHRTAIAIADLPGSQRLLARTLLSLAGVTSLLAGGRTPRDVAARASRVVRDERPSFTVCYVNDCDKAGHAHGWMSGAYLEAAQACDQAAAELACLTDDAETILLVCADHGGGGVEPTDHDAPHPVNDAIPLIAYGAPIAPRQASETPSLLDIPPTVLHALGVPRPSSWMGRPLGCFEAEAVAVG